MGLSVDAMFIAYIFCVLLVLSAVDLDRRIVIDRLVLLALAVSVIRALLLPNVTLYSVFLGAVTFTGTFALIAILGEIAFQKEALGGGDIIFVAALGAFLGLEALPFTLFFGSLFACVFFGVIKSSKRHAIKEIPFIPFLSLAAMAFPLFGARLYAFLIG
jgi:leader peptidase (prepilin peptidase)/N-methyltransferase